MGVNNMKVVISSTEFEGLIKTGGLGDAISGISYALAELDDFEVSVILPDYMNLDDSNFEKIGEIVIKNNDDSDFVDSHFKEIKANVLYQKFGNLNIYLIDNEYYFNRPEIYGYDDDLLRWAFFSRSIYELSLNQLNPDIIHTNDYHEGLVSYLFKKHSDMSCKHILSVHNAYFQGYYEIGSYNRELFEYYIDSQWQESDINLLEQSILNCDKILTVSPDYAEGMQEPKWGSGLEELYKQKGVTGIINGLDYSIHDRQAEDFDSYLNVKKEYKSRIQKKFNLTEDENIPLITYICRLGIQKGSNIVYKSVNSFIDNAQFVLLGTGSEEFEEKFSDLNDKLEDYYAVIDFDSDLARELYIASDIFLMPSCFEPCGISQLIALHYASIPIVTDIGGLKDTVIGYPLENANGFKMDNFSTESLTDSICKSLDIYMNDKKVWLRLMENAYNYNNTWENNIMEYVEIYKKLEGC